VGSGEKANVRRFLNHFVSGHPVPADDDLARLMTLLRSDDLPTPEDRSASAFIDHCEQPAGIPHSEDLATPRTTRRT
jgi:hypothetical protein